MTTNQAKAPTEEARNMKRMQRWVEMFSNPPNATLGRTPRELVAARGKARLYLYRSPKKRHQQQLPILFAPNLGISRPYIFDLLPGSSFIEYVTSHGFDFYLLDWGVFGEEDHDHSWDDCILDTLPRLAQRVVDHSGAPELNLVNSCIGVPLGPSFAAVNPQFPIRNIVSMAGPIDFSKGGMFKVWTDERHFPIDKLIDTLGNMPWESVAAGFKLLKPTMDLSTYSSLWWNADNDNYVTTFWALNKWSNEWVPFPGQFFKQLIKDLYQQNRLFKGEWLLRGQQVDLHKITQPILVVGARQDNIVPAECARGLMDIVGSTDKEYLEIPGGHISLIAGRAASGHLWPKFIQWLSARSN